ncbi:hypothetical protein PHAVU_011G008600 [Phaseolus vulgaris]|uniref:Uncharacterized protein n=1 Tax=Phaseolus vulgaris TaxID=3885 RepID=V7AH23_PHAVU|nr:hypothetical protein PHAVU_011G008600g [Phaseolus vulgaris]ESW03371.1 hypothetical protein PHAVU_011G008600g [Phaseolus vulgaris]
MGSCFEFFLSLKFGKMAKSLVWWTHNNEALPPPSKSQITILERDDPRGFNY